jgi:hypothetical protein
MLEKKTHYKPIQFKTKAQQSKKFSKCPFYHSKMPCPLLAPCPFQILAGALHAYCYIFVCLPPVSFVPNIASFSGLSILYCPFGFL